MNVYINKIAGFLPNAPVSNEDMEKYLGMIDGKPSKARRIILRRNGIRQRYYALDQEGHVTHTNAQMAAQAVRNLLDEHLKLEDIDLLSCGTASPEQLIPSHGVMVHGELSGSKNMEVASFAGSCCTGASALKYACLSVAADPDINAVATASERLSAWLTADYFQEESAHLAQLENNPMLAFEKDFLRWMLSDGAYAALVQSKPNSDALSLHVDWIDMTSFANKMKTCMYAGAGMEEDGTLKGWAMYPQQEWLTKSLFAVKQDTRMLSQYIVQLGVDYIVSKSKKHNFQASDVDWFLPHLSSMFFKEPILKELEKKNFDIPEEKWFLNLTKIGNIASASGFAMLEELMYSGKLKKGQKILVMVPESARFSYCFMMLTVV